MDRSSTEPFWKHVEEANDAGLFCMKCKFCGCLFGKDTSISRIILHLSGDKGHGVAICGQVPKDIQEAAFLAMFGGNKRQKTIASASSVSDDAISSCSEEENNEVDNLARDAGRIQVAAVQDREQGVGKWRTSSCAESGDLMENMAGEMSHMDSNITSEELIVDAHEIRGEASQALNVVDPAIRKYLDDPAHLKCWENSPYFCMEHDIEDVISQFPQPVVGASSSGGLLQPVEGSSSSGGLLQPVEGSSSSGGLLQPVVGSSSSGGLLQAFKGASSSGGLLQAVEGASSSGGLLQPAVGAYSSGGSLLHNIDETRGIALPTTKLVGKAFEENKNVILSWLMNDEVSSIGIYGMGGVGKTTLLAHIYNQLLERPDISHHVCWVTVSRYFSIYTLQYLIAKRLCLDISNEYDEVRRAVELSRELKKKQKWILILDDLWDSFKLHMVGIPFPVKGCKLIVTTRSITVCRTLNCRNKIKVETLSDKEAWALFLEKLGHDMTLSPKVKNIAQSVADECDGLPLGIITMAGIMKGVDGIHEWRNALQELKQSRVRRYDMKEGMFRTLRFSYMHLKNPSLEQCFLYCSLFPEGFEVDRDDLISYLIDEGVIGGTHVFRKEDFDKGHVMLNQLLNVCLLKRGTNSHDESVRMHDLIRDMALQIQQENSQVMVKAGVQLKELPDAEEWTENLVRVSLMENQIKEIPSSHSPRCPSLSTLLLCDNELQFIAYSFFKEMHGLKVLDLSRTNIEKLPDSVSNLVSLNALLLKHCEKLRHVPSLKNLKKLKRLDLSRSTALENVPQGMEYLSSLRYLRLNGCGENEFPSGILPELLNLQVLVLENNMSREYAPVTVKGKEVACLRKLETLECCFEGPSDFMEYLLLRYETPLLSRYQIFVGQLDKFCRNKSVGLSNLSINKINKDGDFEVMLPDNIEELVINNCNGARSLCDVSPSIEYATELEVIRIWYCNSMEILVSSWFRPAPLRSPSFGSATRTLPYSNVMFSSLREFYCYKCTSMKKLFPLVLLPNLVNLERISVVHCEKMEEIIGTRDEGVTGEESSCYSNIEVNLPKLKILELRYLPELKIICTGELICDSLEEIEIWDCEKLKRMSVALSLLNNGRPSPLPSLRRISIYPNKWWETVVEWEHPNTKDILSPLLSFGNKRKGRSN